MSEHGSTENYGLGFLFTDGLPAHEEGTGYRGAVAARASGISYRQLDYWARTELVVPTVRDATGSGSQRLYSFRDILVLKLVKPCSRCTIPDVDPDTADTGMAVEGEP